HPPALAPRDHLIEGRQRVVGAQPRASAKRAWQKVLLVYGGQHPSRAARERPVGHSRHTQRAFLLLAGLRDIDASDVRRSVSLAVDGLQHRTNPSFEAFLRLRYLLAIHPRSGTIGSLT